MIMARDSNPNTPKPGSSTLYRDPSNNVSRGWQGASIGQLKGRRGTPTDDPVELRKAAADTSRFNKVWKKANAMAGMIRLASISPKPAAPHRQRHRCMRRRSGWSARRAAMLVFGPIVLC